MQRLKKKLMKYFIYPLIILTLTMCSSGNDNVMKMAEKPSLSEAYVPPRNIESTQELPVEKSPETKEKKIIKEGEMGIEVEDIKSAKTLIDSLVTAYDAYYANENFSNTDWHFRYNLKIRIPAEYFENFVAELGTGPFKTNYKNISARDVTEEFVDLELRLKNKEKYLESYYELLSQAKTVKDMVDIRETIRKIEEEIEAVKGRMKYLINQVSYSTLDLGIEQEKEYTYKPEDKGNFFNRIKVAVTRGAYGLLDFTVFLIRIWPVIILFVLFFYFYRRFRKRKKRKKQA